MNRQTSFWWQPWRKQPLALRYKKWVSAVLWLLLLAGLSSCRKLLSVPPPATQVTSDQVFSSDQQANSAMAGVYVTLVGTVPASDYFANGLTSRMGALSADELVSIYIGFNFPLTDVNRNKITSEGGAETTTLWTSMYNTIYGANAVIAGIRESSSSRLTEPVRQQLTGEAKFIRAFCYFYLLNFFGDVPLVLTPEPLQVASMLRTLTIDVYAQMVNDLTEAKELLSDDYAVSGGKRIRVNRWGAAALLARTYLYMEEYEKAAQEATSVIQHNALFELESDLSQTFLANSREAIFQLEPNVNDGLAGNATLEGYNLLPMGPFGVSNYLSEQLLSAFEPGDQRRYQWIDSMRFSILGIFPEELYFFPAKYRTGPQNRVIGGAPSEYYMLLRLAEQYLIRAEARSKGADGGAEAAIADLNVLRARAGLSDLPSMPAGEALDEAVAKEWQTELFTEWAHRWFNLKRTGKATETLAAIPIKQPWAGDYQLLYPIPTESITNGSGMQQNPGY